WCRWRGWKASASPCCTRAPPAAVRSSPARAAPCAWTAASTRSGRRCCSRHSLLTPAGRATLQRFLDGMGLWLVGVDRAADILQLLRWADRHDLRIAISGGAEAWAVAPQLAAADVPVFVDPLANLPGSFDTLGASMENAARLHAAGVRVGFSQAGDSSHNARKVRQLAGNAVANGLPWEAALAGLTSMPARVLGVERQVGVIAPG